MKEQEKEGEGAPNNRVVSRSILLKIEQAERVGNYSDLLSKSGNVSGEKNHVSEKSSSF